MNALFSGIKGAQIPLGGLMFYCDPSLFLVVSYNKTSNYDDHNQGFINVLLMSNTCKMLTVIRCLTLLMMCLVS